MKNITVPLARKDEWDDPDYCAAVKEVGYSEDDLFKLHPSFHPVDELRSALWSSWRNIRTKRLEPRGLTPTRDEESMETVEALDSEWNPAAPSPPPPTLMEWDGVCKWPFNPFYSKF